MSKNYTTDTASLKAAIADIRRLNGKEISLNGKNILDYISDSEFDSYDTRDPQLKNDELDIWNTEISLSDNDHIEVKPFKHTINNISSNQLSTFKKATKIINNELFDSDDNHLMYWQTSGITNATGLFDGCTDLLIFDSDLSNLITGAGMFYNCINITSFNIDLPNLYSSSSMFSGCANITSFNIDLPNLYIAGLMFMNCSNLSSFTSNLATLGLGLYMFSGCILDAQSVANIIHTLPNRDGEINDMATGFGWITIGIGCDETEEDKLLFAQECDCETWQELLDEFSAKNWRVQFQCNGRPTTTYNMRRGETLPIYAKIEEVTEGKHYAYTSADGSKFYNIDYFHSTNGSTEGYDVFSSLEEAISTYNVTPKN